MLGGHGPPVTDHVALIDERLRMHERRARKISGLLRPGPLTAYELATAMWGNVAVTQAFLTLSEVLGHLDLLVADGAGGRAATTKTSCASGCSEARFAGASIDQRPGGTARAGTQW